MTYVQAIILAIVQGLGEFLPISSSGHLMLVPALFNWQLPDETAVLAFDVMLHLGTLLALVIFFWRDLLTIFGAMFSRNPEKKPAGRIGWLVAGATVMSVVLALVLSEPVAAIGRAPNAWQVFTVGAFMLLTTFLLLFSEYMRKSEGKHKTSVGDGSKLSWPRALAIGIAQGIAVFPGLSRSGTTIASGLFAGMTRSEATRFSFLLSIPIVLAAAVKTILLDVALDSTVRATFIADSGGWGVLLIGFVVAAVVGYAAIRFMIPFVKKHSLGWFAIYTGLVGVAAIVWSLFNGIVG